MPSIRFAITAAALTPDPRLAATRSRELGFAGLQFDAYGPSLRLPELSISGQREFRHMLDAQNQQLVGLRADLGPKGFGPGSDVDRLLHGLTRAIETAAALRAPLVCIDLGPLPEPQAVAMPSPRIDPAKAGLLLLPEPAATAPPPVSPPPDPAFVALIDAALGALGEIADRYSALLAFRTDLASFAALNAALHRSACPWFGIDLDPVAMLRDEWPDDEIFSRLGAKIRHVRGRDAVAGAQRRTQSAIVGRGDTQWPALLANLDAAGFNGWLTLDPVDMVDRPAAARDGSHYLKKQIEP